MSKPLVRPIARRVRPQAFRDTSWQPPPTLSAANWAYRTGSSSIKRASRESPYDGTIAHGYLTLSLLAALAIEVGLIPVDAKAGSNCGLDKVRSVAPVKTGVRVRNRVVLLAADDKGDGRVLLKTENRLESKAKRDPR